MQERSSYMGHQSRLWRLCLSSNGRLRDLADEPNTCGCFSGVRQVSPLAAGTGARTQRGDVLQAREGKEPVVHGVSSATTIELGGSQR